MSRRPGLPSYRKHKQSGQAIVTFRLPGGKKKDYLLGRYGSKESKAEYARLLGEFQAGHGTMPGPDGPLSDLTINELLVRYLHHCDQYYRNTDGSPTGQAASVRFALRALMEMYGHTLACRFGPLALKAVRAEMVETGNSRKTVNLRVGLIRQFFKWCVAEELVPSSVYEALRTVPGLQPGRTRAPDRKPIRPADVEQVEAALPFMPPPVAALVRLQLLSGARGGDLLGLRAGDIDRSGPVWVYRPPQHKNAWRTRPREIFFGPKAQQVLRPWLERSPVGPLFSPAAAEAERNADRATRR
jgi:integrase